MTTATTADFSSLLLTNGFTCGTCGDAFASAKGRDQHLRSKHKARISVYDHVPDSSTCDICQTTFGHRLSLVAHLADRRVRSKVRGHSCGSIFQANLPPPLDSDILCRLREEDKVARKKALHEGHTHVLVAKLASNVKPSALKGIKTRTLGQAKRNGVKRRLFCKTPKLVANLRFEPRVRYRLARKSQPRFLFLPASSREGGQVEQGTRRRINSKASLHELIRKGYRIGDLQSRPML